MLPYGYGQQPAELSSFSSSNSGQGRPRPQYLHNYQMNQNDRVQYPAGPPARVPLGMEVVNSKVVPSKQFAKSTVTNQSGSTREEVTDHMAQVGVASNGSGDPGIRESPSGASTPNSSTPNNILSKVAKGYDSLAASSSESKLEESNSGQPLQDYLQTRSDTNLLSNTSYPGKGGLANKGGVASSGWITGVKGGGGGVKNSIKEWESKSLKEVEDQGRGPHPPTAEGPYPPGTARDRSTKGYPQPPPGSALSTCKRLIFHSLYISVVLPCCLLHFNILVVKLVLTGSFHANFSLLHCRYCQCYQDSKFPRK